MIVLGLIEVEKGRLFNTAIVVDRGVLIGRYRKVHLLGSEHIFDAGSESRVFPEGRYRPRHRDGERNIDMKLKTKKYDVADYLDSDDMIAVYLDAAFESGDTSRIAEALGDVARARGMTKVAKATGLAREQLYKTLSAEGKPELSTAGDTTLSRAQCSAALALEISRRCQCRGALQNRDRPSRARPGIVPNKGLSFWRSRLKAGTSRNINPRACPRSRLSACGARVRCGSGDMSAPRIPG